MKKAFTLLELIIVIIVVGILSAAIIPRTQSNNLRQAAIEVISSIRYTQHLAMISDRYDPADPTWYKTRWQLIYGKSASTNQDYALSIFRDILGTRSGKPDPGEMAINPLNKNQLLSGGYSNTLDMNDRKATKRLNLGKTYGITDIKSSGDCNGQRISFDNKGRPFVGNSSAWGSSTDGILRKPCVITLVRDSKSLNITIEPETGYTHL